MAPKAVSVVCPCCSTRLEVLVSVSSPRTETRRVAVYSDLDLPRFREPYNPGEYKARNHYHQWSTGCDGNLRCDVCGIPAKAEGTWEDPTVQPDRSGS